MKKAVVCVVLALLLSVLCHEQVLQLLADRWLPARGTESSGVQSTDTGETASFSGQLGMTAAHDTLPVTLYFRFGEKNLLGAEQVMLDIRREETIAHSIVERLIEGPDASHSRLTGVFPQGTRVVSVEGEGSTAYVTLSRDFLGRPDGAPADWEDLEIWQEEAARRRYLAMQSLVLSLTEGARYQRVQLYVADGDDDVPERLQLYWFDRSQTDLSVVLGACARDEQMLLTPARSLQLVLDAWQRRDWETVYLLLAAQDEAHMPAYSVFESQMRERDVSLLTYRISPGTVSMDGMSATLVLDAKLRSPEGGDAEIVREAVLLTRVMDNWTMTPQMLEQLMIRD